MVFAVKGSFPTDTVILSGTMFIFFNIVNAFSPITGIICLIVSILNTVMSLTGAGFQPPPGEIPPEMQPFFDMLQKMQGPVAIITSILGIGISAVIIFAAQKMRALQSYALVVTGAVLAIVPCISPCCCIGIPVGVWVLVVLFKPEVKAMFQ